MARAQVSVAKRQREQAKRERKAMKAARRAERKNSAGSSSDDPIEQIEETPIEETPSE